MCRLYGMVASHPTKAGCDLLAAQNALIHQARRDRRGISNADGWGMAFVLDGQGHRYRQADPAHESERYREHASRVEGTRVLAHVRNATVGEPALVNTHPFRADDQFFAHNGHVSKFPQVRDRLLRELSEQERSGIEGSTDSEHVFHLLRSRLDRYSGDPLDVLEGTIENLEEWTHQAESARPLILNVLWLIGDQLVGSRWGETLFMVRRDHPVACQTCGRVHAHPPPDEPYRALLLASEQLTDEDWVEIPDGSLFTIGSDLEIDLRPTRIARLEPSTQGRS